MPRKSKEIDIPSEVIAWVNQGRVTKAGSIPVLEHYLNCLEKNDGNEQLAVQLCAYAVGDSSMGIGITDSVFIQDQNRHGRSILDRHNGDARAVERLRKALAKNGYTLKGGDHYIPTVGLPFGDPRAIVNHTQGLGDLKRNLSKFNKTVEGEIEIKGEQRAPAKKKVPLHPRIVERIRQQKIKENPDLARKDQRVLREEIIHKHGSKAT
jgi:hypothetical protein